MLPPRPMQLNLHESIHAMMIRPSARIPLVLAFLTVTLLGASIARADLHLSRTGDGELLLTSRQDGMIRMLVPDANAPGTAPSKR